MSFNLEYVVILMPVYLWKKVALGFYRIFKVERVYINLGGCGLLLVDRSTLSQAEWIGMGIQAAPNVITVGEQSGGAVLNRNEIKLMDGTSIDFTKATAFYPKGAEVQCNGLKLDVEIEESAINYNKDLYLESAIELIENENNFRRD